MLQAHVDSLADDSGVAGYRRTNEIRTQFQYRVVVELGCEPLIWQLDPISLHPREDDLEVVSLWADRLHLHGVPWRLRRRHHRLRGEVERDPEHIGVLDVQ